jgi:HEAT repeat protein
VVLRCLEAEDSIAARKFLVDAVVGFSPSSTPALVRRIRSAPWYVARNLTSALARRREALAIPVFRALAGHEHPKVRREAIVALGQFDTTACREILAEVADRPASSPEERELAERALRSTPTEAAKS